MNAGRSSYEAELDAQRHYLLSLLPHAPSDFGIRLMAKKYARLVSVKHVEEALPILEQLADGHPLPFLMLIS
jgi:hypothetical protein